MPVSSKSAWREIAGYGYASPAAAPFVQSPSLSLLRGALGIFDPFRSSLPGVYQWLPPSVADVVALRSDWAMFGMDYAYVAPSLPPLAEGQESLFDVDEFGR